MRVHCFANYSPLKIHKLFLIYIILIFLKLFKNNIYSQTYVRERHNSEAFLAGKSARHSRFAATKRSFLLLLYARSFGKLLPFDSAWQSQYTRRWSSPLVDHDYRPIPVIRFLEHRSKISTIHFGLLPVRDVNVWHVHRVNHRYCANIALDKFQCQNAIENLGLLTRCFSVIDILTHIKYLLRIIDSNILDFEYCNLYIRNIFYFYYYFNFFFYLIKC